MEISPGKKYRMRNGHYAYIDKKVRFESGKAKVDCWLGQCQQCKENKTWNLDGSYAVRGQHNWDLVKEVFT